MDRGRRSPWMACVLCMAGGLAMAVLAWASGLPFVIPSLGPSLVAAAVTPWSRESAPATLAIGHLIALGSGLAALWACGLLTEPSALVAGVTLARVFAVPLALGLTLAGMLAVRRLHPAAAATTLLVALGMLRPGSDTAVLAASIFYVALVVATFPRLAARLAGGAHRTPRRRARATAR